MYTAMLDDYVLQERLCDVAFLDSMGGAADTQDADLPLFLAARSALPVDRARVERIPNLLAAQVAAGGGRDDELAPGLKVHPHRLRHTFAAVYREASGSDTDTAAALGHTTTKYTGLYARKSDSERKRTLQRAMETLLQAATNKG